jgi:adenosylcobinamide-GDP ribazoletransferase
VADRLGRSISTGVRLALTTFTVVPLRPPDLSGPTGAVDRRAIGVAMGCAPAVGLVLGALAGAVGLAAGRLGAPAIVAGTLTIALTVLLTRGLHIDGLADTVDALGSHRPAAAALEIMKRPDIGPFGVAALVLALLLQAGAAGAVLESYWPAGLAATAVATATGRLAIVAGCLRSLPAARPEGLGALVAGTVPAWGLALGAVSVAAVSVLAVPHRPWQGPLAVAGGLVAAGLLLRHAVRRFGGMTGDVLGAANEVGVTSAYVVLVLIG